LECRTRVVTVTVPGAAKIQMLIQLLKGPKQSLSARSLELSLQLIVHESLTIPPSDLLA